ncbi:MAG: ABC transporter permease, partial [[Eubacterium] saphenum]|nr:ABC transporter permease [[Eubacterium] saphenum]
MKAITKNTLREIKGTKSRFLSIFLICVIGVGFFSGVRATCNDMKTSADDYYDKQNLFDLRAVSTFGLTDGDKTAIESVLPEDCSVYTSKYTDLAVERGDKEFLTRVYSKLPDSINTPVILEGRDIENEGECLISCNMLHESISVGDTITLVDLTEAEKFPLKRTEYTVVGRYNSPMYVSMSQRGSTTIGDGALDAFMIVPEDDFTADVYTEIYVHSETLRGMSSYSEEYENYRETLSDKLEELGKE